MRIKKIQIKNKGFTLVETLVYAIGLVLLIGVMTGLMYYMYNWYQYATISSKVDQIGLTLIDRIVRDIRTGNDIDLAQSSLNSNSGSIYIYSKVNGVSVPKKFSLSNGRVQYEENGGSAQYLSPANMTVSRLYFKDINSLISKSIKVELQITFNTRSGTITHDFNGLSIMRTSYK